jgi:magnesium-transporting ATPase (P-type)
VTGDIIKLTEGLLIPADGIIIESRDLYAVEAALTGENDNLKKEPYQSCMHDKEF